MVGSFPKAAVSLVLIRPENGCQWRKWRRWNCWCPACDAQVRVPHCTRYVAPICAGNCQACLAKMGIHLPRYFPGFPNASAATAAQAPACLPKHSPRPHNRHAEGCCRMANRSHQVQKSWTRAPALQSCDIGPVQTPAHPPARQRGLHSALSRRFGRHVLGAIWPALAPRAKHRVSHGRQDANMDDLRQVALASGPVFQVTNSVGAWSEQTSRAPRNAG